MILIPFQDPPTKPIHSIRRSVVVDTKPVTEREASAAFGKVSGLFLRVNGKALGVSKIPSGERPVTRAEVIAEMARIYGAAESTIRFVPASIPFDMGKFRIQASSRPVLSRLVALGYVGKVGPLVVGPEDTLTPEQFGNALGLFASRLAQVTHLPSPKWTPMLREE